MDEQERLCKATELQLQLTKHRLDHVKAIVEKQADTALSIVQWAARGQVLDGDEWKPSGEIKPAVVNAAETFLVDFFGRRPEPPQ